MRILSIETSCDDTGIAVLDVNKDGKFSVMANMIASQVEMGKKYGGVFPAMAKREHQRNLLPTFVKALKESKLLNSKHKIQNSKQIQNTKFKILKTILEREPELYKKLVLFLKKYNKPEIDLISVTNGPGLEPCLWVGVNFAKALSYFWNIPIVPVNHIESHILVNLLNSTVDQSLPRRQAGTVLKFPAIALVVSGGHTQIILVKKVGSYEVLGETRDDAAGECFDKCAKILGLGYPGGPIISALAAKSEIRSTKSETNFKFQTSNFKLPRPMLGSGDYDFSFSGLKTAVLYAARGKNGLAPLRQGFAGRQYINQMCVEIQQAIIDVLIKKTMKAVKDYSAKTLILGGGVSANSELRSQFKSEIRSTKSEINLIFPEPNLSTDNGLMVAVAGYFNRIKKIGWEKIQADGNLRIGE